MREALVNLLIPDCLIIFRLSFSHHHIIGIVLKAYTGGGAGEWHLAGNLVQSLNVNHSGKKPNLAFSLSLAKFQSPQSAAWERIPGEWLPQGHILLSFFMYSWHLCQRYHVERMQKAIEFSYELGTSRKKVRVDLWQVFQSAPSVQVSMSKVKCD